MLTPRNKKDTGRFRFIVVWWFVYNWNSCWGILSHRLQLMTQIIDAVYLPRIRQKPRGLTLLGKADDGTLKKNCHNYHTNNGKGMEGIASYRRQHAH